MHTTIIYYSLSGNCRFAAEGAAALLGAETMELVPEKAYPEKGFAKFFHGGKSAVFGEAPALRPYSFPAETEQVLLVTPIWAGRIAPPLRSFLLRERETLRGKRVAALFCCSGGGTEKAAAQIRELLDGADLEAALTLVDPKDKPSEEKRRALADFCAKLK